MKKLILAMTGAVFVLAACGGNDETTPAPAQDQAPGTYDAATAEVSYQRSCSGCHGSDLQGGNSGVAVTGYTADEVYDAIINGVGSMPARMIPDENAARNVAEWLAEQ